MAVQDFFYEKFIIRSADGSTEVDAALGQFRVISFSYYENILSPFIDGKILISSTSNVLESTTDTQNRSGSIYTGLPLEIGCEIFVKIKDSMGEGLNFSSKKDEYQRLYVNEVQVIDKSSTSETIQIRFISKIGWLNNTKRITKHYSGSISSSVEKIIKDELKFSKVDVTPTSNTYSFAGMSKRPFDLIVMLAKQSMPANQANPGYFAFETKSGFKFSSIDSLINSIPYSDTYYYNGSNESIYYAKDNRTNFKVQSLNILKDQNLINQIRSGVYGIKTVIFNPAAYTFTEINHTVNNNKLIKDPKFSKLGGDIDVPKIIDDDLKFGNKNHRIETAILNVGAETLKDNPNNNPMKYIAEASARYNVLFSQRHNIQVPVNTNLEAGDTINLLVEYIGDSKEQGPDQKQSGKYIIQALCHEFLPERTTTSLSLIRDSYGLHSSKSN